jgi:hypothetical protein
MSGPRVKSLTAVVALLVLATCAEDRYRWNLAHAWLNPRTPLPRKDFEEIVRLVSYATDEPIGAINVSRKSGSLQADVLTSTTVSTHTFVVEKRGAAWFIVSRSEPEID